MSEEKKSAKEIFKIRVADYSRTFGSEHGKRVLMDLIKNFGGDTFDPNPFIMAARAGERRPILRIKQFLLKARQPEKYLAVFEESGIEELPFLEGLKIPGGFMALENEDPERGNPQGGTK